MVRLLVVLSVVAVASSCSCSGCAEKSSPPPVVEVKAPAPVPAPTPTAKAPDAPGRELPYEVKEGSPSDDAVLAAYVADCHATIEVKYDDMADGEVKKADCLALSFDQNCAPDSFGCWNNAEKCRASCGDPCQTCQQKCGDTCDGCKASCDGGDCAATCAKARASCRLECLYEVQRCRAVTCTAAYDTCEAEGAKKKASLCPDCAGIQDCQMKRGPNDAPDSCLKPGNAKECLEWCFME